MGEVWRGRQDVHGCIVVSAVRPMRAQAIGSYYSALDVNTSNQKHLDVSMIILLV